MKAFMTAMGVMVLEFSLIASAVPSQAAQQTKARRDGASLEQTCRDLAGKEEREGEGRSHMGQFHVQRFSDCMMGTPR